MNRIYKAIEAISSGNLIPYFQAAFANVIRYIGKLKQVGNCKTQIPLKAGKAGKLTLKNYAW